MRFPSLRQWLGLLRSLLIYSSTRRQTAKLKKFYAPFIQNGDICFDIGAHVGSRLRIFSASGAQVIALEPQPLFYRYLKFIFGQKPDIVLLPMAVGSKAGQQTMLISERAPTVSSLSSDWVDTVREDDPSFAHVDWNTEIEVTVTTLDALITKYGRPTFCKIDVEGYELEVLRGLTQSIPALSFEYIHTTLDVPQACVQYLKNLGDYQFNYTIIESTEFALADWVEADEIITALNQLPPQATSGDVYARLRYQED